MEKVKVSRNRPEQVQGVPGRLRPRILLTFGTTRVVGRQPYAPEWPRGFQEVKVPIFHDKCTGCQPYAPAAFTSRKYTWYSFLLEAESTPGP